MGHIHVIILEKYLRPLKQIAKDNGIGMSDLLNEMAEWVIDQEPAFRRDLKADLEEEPIEEKVSAEDVSDSEDEEEEEDESESEEEEKAE